MAYKGKSLADGTMGSSQAQIYKSPAGERTIVRTLHCYNPNATAETVNIYLRRGAGTIRQVYRAVLAQYESFQFTTDAGITLSSEDSLYGDTTSSVNYVLTGATE